jgi:hypothetical protein
VFGFSTPSTLPLITHLPRSDMPDYMLKVECQECGEKHSAQVRVFLGDGPETEQSVAEAYRDKPLSDSVNSLIFNTISLCPKSNHQFKQTDPGKVFLCPLPEPDLPPEVFNPSPGHVIHNEASILEQLALTYAQHPQLSQNERFRFSTVMREIARHPLGPKITGEVILSMLFSTEITTD